jgi:hypothetical protein
MRNNILCFWTSFWSIILFHLLAARPAFAYLDPGTGSYIFQILIAAVVGAMFVIKPFFLKIKNFFRKIFVRGTDDEQAQ